jgi:uncharacterized phage protein (TIGR01671 family)
LEKLVTRQEDGKEIRRLTSLNICGLKKLAVKLPDAQLTHLIKRSVLNGQILAENIFVSSPITDSFARLVIERLIMETFAKKDMSTRQKTHICEKKGGGVVGLVTERFKSVMSQRPIKFRAWNKAFARMEYSREESVIRGGRPERDSILVVPDDKELDKFWLVYFRDKWTVVGYSGPIMQFTGLRDKAGKEIYEGDIVRLEVQDVTGENDWRIEWDERACGFVFQSDSRLYPDDSVVVDGGGVVRGKIIGNVWENPELLT